MGIVAATVKREPAATDEFLVFRCSGSPLGRTGKSPETISWIVDSITPDLSGYLSKRFFMPLESVVSVPRALWRGRQCMAEPAFRIEEVSDPQDLARARAQDEHHRRNSDWLQAHWAEVLPQARGKFLAVAGQESFIADTPEAAWAWVATTHPEDDGAIVQYIRPETGPRIYVGKR
jgi:hypothetical protein